MRSHRAIKPTKVPNGMAVLDACAHTKRFRTNMVVKSNPGTNMAVYYGSAEAYARHYASTYH